ASQSSDVARIVTSVVAILVSSLLVVSDVGAALLACCGVRLGINVETRDECEISEAFWDVLEDERRSRRSGRGRGSSRGSSKGSLRVVEVVGGKVVDVEEGGGRLGVTPSPTADERRRSGSFGSAEGRVPSPLPGREAGAGGLRRTPSPAPSGVTGGAASAGGGEKKILFEKPAERPKSILGVEFGKQGKDLPRVFVSDHGEEEVVLGGGAIGFGVGGGEEKRRSASSLGSGGRRSPSPGGNGKERPVSSALNVASGKRSPSPVRSLDGGKERPVTPVLNVAGGGGVVGKGRDV
ncbi:hypothetical protein HDU97_005316, partial [Phlyctochytrium planicorne]